MSLGAFTNSAHEEFILGAANAFASCAMLQWCEEQDDDEINRRYCLDGDEFDAHTLPASAVALAGRLWAELSVLAGSSVYVLMSRIAEASGESFTGDDPCNVTPFDANKFGWYAAMQAIGHGVGLSDFWQADGVEVPWIEPWEVDGESVYYIYNCDF